jgi:hypothetical protein
VPAREQLDALILFEAREADGTLGANAFGAVFAEVTVFERGQLGDAEAFEFGLVLMRIMPEDLSIVAE